MHTFSISKIQSQPVPVPPADKHERIRSEFERMDVATSSALAAVGGEVKRAVVLRQAALKVAIYGELMSQDPNDKPASIVLARPVTQAADAPAASRGHIRKAAA